MAGKEKSVTAAVADDEARVRKIKREVVIRELEWLINDRSNFTELGLFKSSCIVKRIKQVRDGNPLR